MKLSFGGVNPLNPIRPTLVEVVVVVVVAVVVVVVVVVVAAVLGVVAFSLRCAWRRCPVMLNFRLQGCMCTFSREV